MQNDNLQGRTRCCENAPDATIGCDMHALQQGRRHDAYQGAIGILRHVQWFATAKRDATGDRARGGIDDEHVDRLVDHVECDIVAPHNGGWPDDKVRQDV